MAISPLGTECTATLDEQAAIELHKEKMRGGVKDVQGLCERVKSKIAMVRELVDQQIQCKRLAKRNAKIEKSIR